MARIAAGDRDAFAALVAHSRDGLYRYVRALVRDDQTAQDTLQEVFLGVWRGARSWRAEGPARIWLYGVARRLAARSWRRRVGEPGDLESLEELAVAAGFGEACDPEAQAQAHEDHARVHAAIERLSPDDAEIITLRDLEGFSGAEAALILGIDVGAVKSRLHRARLRLLAEIRADGGTNG